MDLYTVVLVAKDLGVRIIIEELPSEEGYVGLAESVAETLEQLKPEWQLTRENQ